MVSQSPLASHPPPDPAVLGSWLKGRGVRQHQGIQPRLATDGSGWGVWASEDIGRGQILCAIPRRSILSARTSSLRRPYQPESAADIILHLTACLLHELRSGEESEWYGWLQMIPRETVVLPTLWTEEEVGGKDGRKAVEWLVGTEAEKQLQRKNGEGLSLEALRSYHSTLELPSTPTHHDQSSFPAFLYAYSMVSSRGFALDSYHLIGLIPFCDMFNHSSSHPHTSLSVDSSVCETCGSLLRCEHDTADSERIESLPAAYLAKLEEDGMADMVDMRVQKDIKAGEQVFSCYDEEHADAELMVEYGFIEGGNTAITWSYRDFLDPGLPEIAQRYMALLQHTSQVIGNGEDRSNLLIGTPRPPEEQPEPLVIRPNGEVSWSLATILFNANANSELGIEEMAESLESALGNLNRRNPASTPEQVHLANAVCSLIQKRLASFHHKEMSTNDLETLINALSPKNPLQRMAAEHMLSERRHLEERYNQWRALAP